VETKIYTVKASQGVRYDTPAFALGGEGGCAASIEANMAIHGDTTQEGAITATGDVQGRGISLAGHTHPGDSGGTTGEPL
ncbi:MAG: phage baseplate assembly protein V, partial [Desulfovibrio sp.]|nr:phage baseplate assembly protein V [Desulfovibrio sp.]